MSLVLILLKQIIVMFILMSIGYSLFKTKKITLEGNRELGMVLIYVILPASIIRSYITSFSMERVVGLFISFTAAIVSLFISVMVSRLAFGNKRKIEHFGTAFSNAGFMGIPLVKAVVGDEAVFYIAAFIALLNFLQWTYGVVVMSGKKDAVSIKKVITNPVIISLTIGVALFLTQIPVNTIFVDVLTLVGNMTAPVAMITLGVYLAQIKWRELFTEKWAYYSMLLRLFIIPILTIGVLSLIPAAYRDIKLAILIAAAAPVGSNVAIFAQLNGLNYKTAVTSVCLSTICSIVSMPIIVGVAGLIW